MNRWFEEVFLPSIFSYSGAGPVVWISRQQVDVCKKYMRQNSSFHIDGYGKTFVGCSWTYIWKTREIVLTIEHNGAGRISFGANDEEKKNMAEREEQKQWDFFVQHVRRMKEKRPEVYKKEYNQLLKQKENIVSLLSLSDLEDEERKDYEKELATCEKKLSVF